MLQTLHAVTYGPTTPPLRYPPPRPPLSRGGASRLERVPVSPQSEGVQMVKELQRLQEGGSLNRQIGGAELELFTGGARIRADDVGDDEEEDEEEDEEGEEDEGEEDED